MPYSIVAAAILLGHLSALAADPAVITNIAQRPWIINAAGVLKSETELTIENHRGQAVDAWVKIRVPGKPDCMEALGSLPTGASKRVVHVPELTTDGEPVTFAIHDNAAGNTAPIGTKTLPQQKIRHWRIYVGHNSHMDIGYTEFQEDLKTKTWPGFWDQALLEDMPRSDSWPDDANVRLEVEAVYQLDTSLPVRSADWFEMLRERLAQGRFAYGAAFGNNAHSNWGTEELARSCYPAERHFKDKTGVESSKNIIMRDEPVLSWGVIDALVEAGAKSFAFQHNADHNPWRGTTTYPELFYAQGRNPANRLLVWNAPVGNYSIDELGFRDKDLTKLTAAISAKLMGYQAGGTNNHRYPYDLVMVNFTYDGDNRPMDTQVYDNIKALNDKGYVYPRIINANYDRFFEDVAARWGDKIPSFKGTIEDWWNFGAASTAYETGINRMNHDKLAAAETLATVAGIAIPERRHPSEALANAYENLLLYDEHTWGSPTPAVDEQWRWKRNTAIASDVASAKVLNESMAAIASRIPASGPTIVVYNNLSWTRSDLVNLGQEQLPAHFSLADGETGTPVRHQKSDDGTVVFVAGNVPGHGYKTFNVTARDSDPPDPPSITATANTLENQYFKVTFDQTGNVTSILDKQHGNKEIVDPAAPQPLNQYVLYKDGALAGQVNTATLAASAGPVLGCMSADGTATGLDSLRRKVVLYDALPRIDIINDAVKGKQIAKVEMGYFAFPLKVDNFMLRHEMPTGDMKPGVTSDINDPNTEQYFTSSTAFYTVNRWIDASNQRDWGVTFAALNAPLVSYGRPDIGMSKGGWDTSYNAPKPWIYSMAFNNEWQTNFQKTQPGRVVFRYSLRGHAGGTWQAGNAETFGAETSSPLRASVIKETQPGHGFDAAKGQFVGISEANVTLTTAKMAEANGEGIIIRFNEIKGAATSVKVDLGWFRPGAVTETDLAENDKAPMTLADGVISFTIQPFGFKTFRLIRGAAPQAVTGVTAAFDAKGCLVAWKDQPDAVFFEVFRGTSPDFKPGTGTYLSTVGASHYYDPTVKDGLTRTYYYAVRAAGAGQKSRFSVPVKALTGLAADTTAPSLPVLAGEALHATKVTLSWEPSTDNHAVAGYQVFRDGTRIADVSAVFNSWMDDAVKPGTTYRYTVKARDIAGNLSPDGGPAAVTTLRKSP